MFNCIYYKEGKCLLLGKDCEKSSHTCEEYLDLIKDRITTSEADYVSELLSCNSILTKEVGPALCKLFMIENLIKDNKLVIFPRMYQYGNIWVVEDNTSKGIIQKTFLLEENAIEEYNKLKNK